MAEGKAGKDSRKTKTKTVSCSQRDYTISCWSHSPLAIRGNKELVSLMKATIAGGGVIHKSLIGKKVNKNSLKDYVLEL
uniref:Histone H2A C-terminal domain-containing protein n=1 Tax=Laticauda laticaudata TaxID=8630 RepID=A0A8C5SLD1_LATLA